MRIPTVEIRDTAQNQLVTSIKILSPVNKHARLHLTLALQTIYERAGYDLSINYAEPPPPPELSEAEERLRQTSIAAWHSNA